MSPSHSSTTDTQKSLPSFTKPYNVASSKIPDITSVFLDQMKDLKSQMLQIQQTQNFLLKNIMSQAWPPLTSPESKPIPSTNVLNEACPNPSSMFHFLFMNIAHLISRTKQKLKFLADLCDANTLFLCFCETFLHGGIGDIEIQLPDF